MDPQTVELLTKLAGPSLAIGPGVTLEGVGIVARPWHGQSPTTLLYGCAIMSGYGNGLSSTGGVAFSSNVRIHASQYDGFNYGCDDDGNPNLAIEHNCHVSEAGDVSTYGRFLPSGAARDNLNGSSSHSSTVVRYGGLYEGSMGPDIADTSDASQPDQVSMNFGVMTRSSKIGVGYLFFGANGNPTAYLNNCASENQTIDILAADGARVMCCKSDLPKTRLTNGGKIEPYFG